MKMFNKQIQLREFSPPIIFRLLKKVRYGLMSSAAKKAIEEQIAKEEANRVRPYTSPVLKSYSQFNEDLLIDLLFLSKDNGFYVDVGANDPVFNSNTKRFYDKGWHGINIEPGVEQFEKFASSRPRDINLNVGVGSVKGKVVFYKVVGDSTLSSFNKNVAEKMATKFKLSVDETDVTVFRLEDIFDTYVKNRHVDFISIDAEGIDLEVLKSNDWDKFRPSLVMVEVDSQYSEIITYMSSHNYLHVFNNFHNAFFLDRKTSEITLKTLVDDALVQ